MNTLGLSPVKQLGPPWIGMHALDHSPGLCHYVGFRPSDARSGEELIFHFLSEISQSSCQLKHRCFYCPSTVSARIIPYENKTELHAAKLLSLYKTSD